MKKKFQINFRITIILCCLIPMFTGIITSLVITLTKASSELVEANKTAIMAMTNGVGEGLDDHIAANEAMLKAFASSAEVQKYLKDQSNAELKAECQQYTEDYFSKLDGWEGLYVADWSSRVMSHSSNPDIVDVILREGDALTELQNNMLNNEGGFYNAGVITSPSSGELTFSMYCIVYDGDTPIGYVGGGTFLKNAIEKYSDVSALNLNSAYLYAVDSNGTMLFHKDESKIGNPVENEVVKGLVADIQSGKHPEPDVVVYEYKGADKIAGYYVDKENSFITVITCDKSDTLKTTKQLIMICIPVTLALIAVFVFIAIIVAHAIAKPLVRVVDVTTALADGELNSDTDIHSIEKETNQLIEAVKTLQHNLRGIVENIRSTSNNLSSNVAETNTLCSSSDDGAKQISGAIDELARATQSMAENVQTLAMDMGDIANSIDAINNATGELKETTSVIEMVSDEAKKDIISVAESAQRSVEAATNIDKHMTQLSSAISEINQATELIQSISSQTALLSLNASIEAARAGEAGKGFAVVAGEISKLAEQSDEGTRKIDEVTQTLLNLSEQSLRLTREIADAIKDEQVKVKATEDSFLKLKEQIDLSLTQINTIAGDVEVLNSAKDEANSAVQDLSAISEENAASNEEVTASVSSLAGNISDIAGRSDGLERMSEVLQDAIKVFK